MKKLGIFALLLGMGVMIGCEQPGAAPNPAKDGGKPAPPPVKDGGTPAPAPAPAK